MTDGHLRDLDYAREYTASLDDAALLSRVAGTGAEHEARQLLARLQASGTLDDPDMTRLAAVIGDYPGLLAEDDEHWTSTGASEVTHIELRPVPARGTMTVSDDQDRLPGVIGCLGSSRAARTGVTPEPRPGR